MGALLTSVGAISAIWGSLWYLWDHNANAPIYLLAVGLFGLIAGGALS
jgi:hypothetical protein